MLRLACRNRGWTPSLSERVRAQIEAGIRHEMNDPDSMAGKAFFEAAFPAIPMAGLPHGTPESLPQITRDDLEQLTASALLARDTLKIARGGSHRRREPCARARPGLRRRCPSKGAACDRAGCRPGQCSASARSSNLAIPQTVDPLRRARLARKDPGLDRRRRREPHSRRRRVLLPPVPEVREKRGLAYSV